MSKITPLPIIPNGNYALLKSYQANTPPRIVQIISSDRDTYWVREEDGQETIVPLRLQMTRRLIDLGQNLDIISVLY